MEQEIIALLQSDNYYTVIKNTQLERRLFWWQGEWVVRNYNNKTLVATEDLQLALKWLKGEQ